MRRMKRLSGVRDQKTAEACLTNMGKHRQEILHLFSNAYANRLTRKQCRMEVLRGWSLEKPSSVSEILDLARNALASPAIPRGILDSSQAFSAPQSALPVQQHRLKRVVHFVQFVD